MGLNSVLCFYFVSIFKTESSSLVYISRRENGWPRDVLFMDLYLRFRQKPMRGLKESIALAEIFVEMKANQTKKEANQAKKEATQAQKEAKQAQKEAIKMLTGRSRAATTSWK